MWNKLIRFPYTVIILKDLLKRAQMRLRKYVYVLQMKIKYVGDVLDDVIGHRHDVIGQKS